MSPFEYMILPFKRYADFSGRSRRMEYWMFSLFNLIVLGVLVTLSGGLGALTGSSEGALGVFGLIMIAYFLAVIVPSLAVGVRRFHDQDKSGWFILLNFIPYIGGLIVFVMMLLNGTQGDNKYGPDPKGGSAGSGPQNF